MTVCWRMLHNAQYIDFDKGKPAEEYGKTSHSHVQKEANEKGRRNHGGGGRGKRVYGMSERMGRISKERKKENKLVLFSLPQPQETTQGTDRFMSTGLDTEPSL